MSIVVCNTILWTESLGFCISIFSLSNNSAIVLFFVILIILWIEKTPHQPHHKYKKYPINEGNLQTILY